MLDLLSGCTLLPPFFLVYLARFSLPAIYAAMPIYNPRKNPRKLLFQTRRTYVSEDSRALKRENVHVSIDCGQQSLAGHNSTIRLGSPAVCTIPVIFCDRSVSVFWPEPVVP